MRLWLLLFWISTISVSAQQAELWSDVTLNKQLNKKLTLFGDLGPRLPVKNGTTYVFYIRPSVSYQLNKVFTIAGGAAVFNTYINGSRTTEYRGWQGIRADVKLLRNIIFNTNMRMEERTFTGDTNRKNALRFRLLSGFTFLLNNSSMVSNTWYAPVAYEIFEDLNGSSLFINRRRLYIGLGYVFNPNVRTEIFYIDNEARATASEDFLSVDVIRIRFHITLPSKQNDY